MATISNASLRIVSNPQTKTSQCTISCRVGFTQYEFNEMPQGLRFALHASLWGDDLPPINPDDFLFSYASIIYPDASPGRVENATFTATVGTSLLDEDFGRDEVFGQLTLKNLYTGNVVKAKTNVVKREF
jgi:hypothetical protein